MAMLWSSNAVECQLECRPTQTPLVWPVSVTPTEALYAALKLPQGLVLATPTPSEAQLALRQTREALGDPALSCLSIVIGPDGVHLSKAKPRRRGRKDAPDELALEDIS